MKTFLKRAALALLALVGLTALIISIEYFGGQPMGLFSGSRPSTLGFSGGQFAPPSWKPNTVSSTVPAADTHYIAPLAFSGSTADSWEKLPAIVAGSSRAKLITNGPAYLHAEFRSAGLGFVDDVEFALDEKAGVIQVRSASRLGVRDFGVNRARVESIRGQFAR